MSMHLKEKKKSATCLVRGNLSVLAFGIWHLEAMCVSHIYTVCISEFVWKFSVLSAMTVKSIGIHQQ
jgi:hypothetical protein